MRTQLHIFLGLYIALGVVTLGSIFFYYMYVGSMEEDIPARIACGFASLPLFMGAYFIPKRILESK